MANHVLRTVSAALCAVVVGVVNPAVGPAAAAALPAGRLTGWDTFRRLDLLPYLSTQDDTRQFSSFDRTGGNEYDGFDGRYSCRRVTAEGCVLAEDSGAGEIASIWFTRLGGDLSGIGRIVVTLDGRRVLDAGLQQVVDGGLGAPFTYPLVANAGQSSGGTYIKVPMPYRTSMSVVVQNNPGFYHVTYRHFADPTGVSTFDPADRADDVLAKLGSAGTADPKPAMPGAVTAARTLNLAPGQASVPVALTGPGVVTAVRLRMPQVSGADAASDEALAATRLRIAFDGRTTVDAPVGEFFGSGLGEYHVRSLMFAMDTAAGGWYSAWWPMPYATGASVTLVNGGSATLTNVELRVTSAPDPQWTAALAAGGDAGHFTALARRADTEPWTDWVFAELTGRGKFVGVSHTMNGTDPGVFGRGYLEGDERVYVDNAQSPQLHGTGTEDFYEAGWYFDHGPFTAPTTGHSAHETRDRGCRYECDAAYRLMLTDAVGYRTHLRFDIEHGGTGAAPATYGSTAYLYARPSRAARVTDSLDLRDQAARTAHSYTETGTVTVTDVSSPFEGENDHLTVPGQARSTGAPVTFRMAVDPGNRGATLRRTGDQSSAYQSARVLVDGAVAGRWVQPLGNAIQRWLDDAFALPAGLTTGKSAITIRLEPEPGAPQWTAARYTVTSVVQPIGGRPTASTDVDGDGRGDVVAFTQSTTADVFVARSTGTSFGTRTQWHDAFAPAGEVPMTADVDGDGRADIVSFTRGSPWAAVDVALSTGTSFGPRTRWHDHFSPAGETSAVGDVNGDGRDDIVTFTHGSPWAVVYVALSTGTSFGPAQQWHPYFGAAGEDTAVADVDGDGRADLVGFTRGGTARVYVALSTGASFGTAAYWHGWFAPAGETPRVGDINGDGFADIVAFTGADTARVYASLSTGAAFGPAAYWHGAFAPGDQYPYLGDVTGDGLADALAFTRDTAADVFAATSTGWAFGDGRLWHDAFGFPGETVLQGSSLTPGAARVVCTIAHHEPE